MELLDCGDNSCNFARDTGGMRTNGGCRCLKAIDQGLRSKINYTFHKLRSDHDALKMSLESIIKHEDKKQAELSAALLQISALQNEVEFLSKQRAENITLRLDIAAKEGERLGTHRAWMTLNEEEQKTAYENRELRAALEKATDELETLLVNQKHCGDPGAECPMQDSHKPGSTKDIANECRDILGKPLKPKCAPECCKRPAEIGLCCLCDCHKGDGTVEKALEPMAKLIEDTKADLKRKCVCTPANEVHKDFCPWASL